MAGIGLVKPFNIIIAKEKTGPIIGHEDFKFRVNNNWGILGLGNPVKDCHEMVLDKKSELFYEQMKPRIISSSMIALVNYLIHGDISVLVDMD